MKTAFATSLISTVALARKPIVDSFNKKVESPLVEDCISKCLKQGDANGV